MNLKNIFSELIKTLDKLDHDREEILKISRQMIRNCSIAIKSIHRKEFDLYLEKIKEIKIIHENLLQLVEKNLLVFGNYLKTPEQELIEAVGLYAIIKEENLPAPEDYKVQPINFLLGLADIIGELRRYILDKIRTGDYENLEKILGRMEEIYTYLFSLDYPKCLTRDLRRKTDVARSIIEKTRGDISLSIQIDRLNKNLTRK